MIDIATARTALGALPWRSILAVVIAACSFAAGWAVNGWRLGEQLQQLEATHAQEREGRARAVATASEAARAEEQRRIAEQKGIADAASKERDQAVADARAANAAADKLRTRVAQLVAASRTASHTTAAGSGPGQPGGDPLDMLVDVLSRTDSAAGQLGEYADKLKVAGLACERSYDALTRGEKTMTEGAASMAGTLR
ncbi:DUF2514 family protein [Ralstonia mannitolilytica]|uniref:DUF2514 family protein n=1 Tax=Ralstonia mannitolilytica TaxID=105219 RepID=UPI00292F1153|nr:DUF2514 family protein [Ralstonia mannitolilytica]